MKGIPDTYNVNWSAIQLTSFIAYDRVLYSLNIWHFLKFYFKEFVRTYFNNKRSFMITNNDKEEKIAISVEEKIEYLSLCNYIDKIKFYIRI